MPEYCNCDECVDDPSLTCSYTGEDVSIESVYVANAYKGHLILCPGGSNGDIGGLLHQLDPPQHYTHMGIVVSDFDLVRHCTAMPGRLTASEYYTDSVFGVAAPVDGLNIDHVQFGWPGTVTQSAQQIHYADRYESLPVPGTSGPYHGSDLRDPESPSGQTYRVGAVSFDSVFDDGRLFPALVVKPCPALEDRQVTEILRRVAETALDTYAHYRFYAYTDGAIGQNPDYLARPWPVPAARPAWDPQTMTWRDWADPDSVRWLEEVTTGAVCSSFVWDAIQEVSRDYPKVTLDWAPTHEQALGRSGGACVRALEPDWDADSTDSFTLDGLYVYDPESRRRAAAWLKDSLEDKVYQSLKDALVDAGGVQKTLAGLIDTVGRGTFIAAAADGTAALVGLLAPLTITTAITGDLADQLIQLLYDMPSDIANQVVNSFAFDCHRGFPADISCVDGDGEPIRDVDSTNFLDAPGIGRAVSPDNIHMFWDAPGAASTRKEQLGLYGHNEPVALVVAVVRKPRCELVPSTGLATIAGVVRHAGKAVAGAYVKVNCQRATSLADDGYQLRVRAGGHHKVVARWRDPATGVILYGERTTQSTVSDPLAPGQWVELDFDLVDPPQCLRNVTVAGTVRVDDVYLTDSDHAETQFSRPLYVQSGVPRFDEGNGRWTVDGNDPAGRARQHDVTAVGASVGDANGNLRIEATARADLSVDVRLVGSVSGLTRQVDVHLPDGATANVPEFGLDSGGEFPERAYFRHITISNRGTKAI